jgi:hypothetical protein
MKASLRDDEAGGRGGCPGVPASALRVKGGGRRRAHRQSHHTSFDGSKTKLPAMAQRKEGDPHPYDVGHDSVTRSAGFPNRTNGSEPAKSAFGLWTDVPHGGGGAIDPVRTMVGDGFRSNPRARSYRRRDGGDQNGDGRRAPRPCSGRPASRLHRSQTPPVDLEGTCDARFSQAGRDALGLARLAFLDDPGGRTYGGGSCPSYLSMMRSYFTPS